MNQPPTTTEADEPAIPNVPIEPIRLVGMWREAAQNLAKQGEGAAAGAFVACAQMLETWVQHEGTSAIMCMPRSMLGLIHAAHAFDSSDKETWKNLGRAADHFRSNA